MPAVPKRRTSKRRGANRRSHWALKVTQLVHCDQCGAAKMPHQVCPACGKYRGIEVIELKKEEKK